MRKIRLLLLMLGMFLMLCGFTSADQRVFDEADLFTDSQERTLESMVAQIREEAEMDLVVVTADDTRGKEAYQYAEWFYYDAGYSFGYGGSDKGALYLIDLDNREIYVYCSEKGDDYISDGEIEDLLDAAYPYVVDGEYFESAAAFLEKIPDCASKSKAPIIIGIVISFVIAVVVTLVLVGKQKSGGNVSYRAYMVEGDTRMYRREDRFIHTTVVVRHLDNDSSGGGSGGGSHSRGSGGGRSF